nr:hypothetical protein [uncultured Carboxylicivirga sp.]
MNNSVIASNHHFYLVLFELNELSTCEELLNAIQIENYTLLENENEKLTKNKIFHFQKKFKGALGSIDLLIGNKMDKEPNPDKAYYLYDLYCGKTNVIFASDKKDCFFICFPYKALQSIIFDRNTFKNSIFYIPSVPVMLKHFQNGKMAPIQNEIDSSIIKYSADIVDEANADNVSIIGKDPLNSSIFKLMIESDEIDIEVSSLKLNCTWKEDYNYSFNLLFDRLGNYRFWIPKNKQKSTLPMLEKTFTLFSEINGIEQTERLSKYTTVITNE